MALGALTSLAGGGGGLEKVGGGILKGAGKLFGKKKKKKKNKAQGAEGGAGGTNASSLIKKVSQLAGARDSAKLSPEAGGGADAGGTAGALIQGLTKAFQ